jgi:hypothetical protein
MIMPISIRYDPNQNVLYSDATGEISLEDIMSYYSEIERMDLKPQYSVLADYSGASADINYDDVTNMASRRQSISQKAGAIKIAVVSKNDLAFGLGRMYQSLIDNENIEVNVFRDRGKAEQWLGIKDID